MHVAIDDTYGPEACSGSRFVTGARRTHVALILPDEEVDDYRNEIRGCLLDVSNMLGTRLDEFHFADVYNRRKPWHCLPEGANLAIFEAFADIYHRYRWPVHIQTVDERTLSDHGACFGGKLDGLDLAERADLSLFFLLVKIKTLYSRELPLKLLLDEGRGTPGQEFGSVIFRDWAGPFSGSYASSAKEPLLQLADFLAFCINRTTHLALKAARTDLDHWFLGLVSSMEINCPDLLSCEVSPQFTIDDFDGLHEADRIEKGLPPDVNS